MTDNSAAGLTAQLDAVWTSLEQLGESLTDEEWGRATPCPGWPVAAQYAHIIGTESSLLGRPNPEVDPGSPEHVRNRIGGFNEVWVAALAPKPRQEVLDMFKEVTAARRRELAGMSDDDFSKPSWTPVGESDYRRFMQIRVFDCWVHEQDVRDAVGRPGHDDGPVAEQSIDEIVRAIGFIVGKKAGAPDGSSVRFDLTGPVSRRVDVAVVDGKARQVDTIDGEPTTTISLTSSDFARLACGRTQAGSARFEVAGDEALGQQVVSHLAFTI